MPTASETVGAGNRLSAASQHAQQRAAERLAPKLEKANTATYLRSMRAHAAAFGADKPKAVTDTQALADIAARARVSADSIVSTQQQRMAALVAKFGGLADAQAPFKDWELGQRARIAAFESGQTVNAGYRDLLANNPELAGLEHVEPREGICAACNEAIDMGDVPLGTLPDMPIHVSCVHSVVAVYELPDDVAGLWFGEE